MNNLAWNRLENMLQLLHSSLQTEQRILLAGKEGIGKSWLARTYTERFGQEYRAIAWIDAATDETFLADLHNMLQKFSLPVDTTLGAMELFLTLYEHLQEQQQALLVLDHLPFAFKLLDSPQQESLSYHLLLITQREQTPAELPRLEMTGLDEQDGALLILSQAGLLTQQESLDAGEDTLRMQVLELAREIQGWPLALRLAGGYLRQNGGNAQEYLDVLRAYPAHPRLDVNSQPELARACEVGLNWIEQTHPEAGEILRLSALLLPDAIPATWVQQGDETLQILAAMGLLDASEDLTMLSMHPLLQQMVSQFYGLDDLSQQQQQTEPLFRHLQRFLPSLAEEPLSTRLRVVGHIRHLANLSQAWEITQPEAAEVFTWAARHLWENHLLNQAEAVLRRALEIWEKTPGASQHIIAAALEKLVALNSQLGNYAEAESLAHRLLASTMANRDSNYPDVLNALLQLGQTYAAQNKAPEAKACYEKVIQMAETLKLRLHPVYSTAKYSLALLYIAQGRFELAEDLLLRVCVVWSHILGESNRSTIEARLKLAEVAARLQHWQQAHSSYQKALSAYEEVQGTADPLLPAYQARAATVMFQLGKLAEAKHAWQRLLATQEQTWGTRISCINGLARIALAEGNRVEALDLLAPLQEPTANQEPTARLEWAELLETLGSVREAGGEYEQAEQAASKALELRERLVGRESLELIENLSDLARFHLALGKEEEAEKLLLRALYSYQREQKPEDMRLDPVLQSLAEIEIRRQRFDMARMYQQRIRAIRALTLSENDPRILEIEERLSENERTQKLRP